MNQKSFLFSIIGILLCFVAFFAYSSSFNSEINLGTIWDNQEQIMVLDFEGKNFENMTTNAAQIEATTDGVTHGKQALKVSVKGGSKTPGFSYRPSTPIDATSFKNYCLVFDATNITEDYSVQFFVSIQNDKGQSLRRSDVIPIGKTKSYFFMLAGEYFSKDVGLRDDPNPWDTESIHMKIRGLKTEIDFSKITSIDFYIEHPIANKSMILDNIRIVESPPIADDYLVGIFDKYGQAAKLNFPDKVTSDEELKQLAKKELFELEEEGTMAERSKFGGWSKGPKLEATGYFRTEKIGGKWAMVDPEGYLFFSHGLANVRMANTTSFTGIDFRNEKVRYRDPEDVTPEDSRGMVKLSSEVTSTAYNAYPWRNKMFLDLPTYDDPLANNYSYRREQHIGPFKHGETFSHYQANLERRYGEETEGAHLKKWIDVTLDRFLNWGFTSFGNWAAEEFYHENRMPYFANGWIIGDFKTVASGYWGPMPDVFDPEFKRRARLTVDVVADEVKGNPWCVGVFIDNEKSWGRPGSVNSEHEIVIDALSMNSTAHPIKEKFMEILRDKYKNVESLNTAWGMNFPTWEVLAKGQDFKRKSDFSKGMLDDFSLLLEKYAHKYFQIVHDALAEKLPNHLYMGCRFATWGMSKEVRSAAKKYVDVFSYNYYHEALSEEYWKFLEDIDRPSLIGEFHIGVKNAGLFHPGLVIASDQEDRAKMYKNYMRTVIDNPYFVGAHWFQYLDSPTSGRAHDGENYNVGFVKITDVPYAPMVQAAKEINKNLYKRRFGK